MTKDKLLTELKEVIEDYLNKFVKLPTFETCENDIFAQHKIVCCLTLLTMSIHVIQKKGVCVDLEYLKELPEQKREKRIKSLEKIIKKLEEGEGSEEAIKIMKDSHTRKFLLPYLEREFNWVVVSILSASYISAFVLMRSILELLVEIATNKRGSSTKESIKSISFLSSTEQGEIKNFWKHLSGWSHPYGGKWEREVCPIYISHRPRYHVKFCTQAIEDLMKLVDFFLVIGLEKFKISKNDFLKEAENEDFDNLDLTLFQNRS